MSPIISKNILRFILLFLLQILIFKGLNVGGVSFNYVQVLIYPLFLILLPISIGKNQLLLLGLFLGLSVDIFYDSPGLHASAALFTAFVRPFLLSRMAPRGGYKVNTIPTLDEFGSSWFYSYSGILLLAHLLFYFSVEAFQFSQILQILLKTSTTFIVTMLMVVIYMLIFNPKE